MSAIIGFLLGMIVGAVLLMIIAVAITSKDASRKEEEYRRVTKDDGQD